MTDQPDVLHSEVTPRDLSTLLLATPEQEAQAGLTYVIDPPGLTDSGCYTPKQVERMLKDRPIDVKPGFPTIVLAIKSGNEFLARRLNHMKSFTGESIDPNLTPETRDAVLRLATAVLKEGDIDYDQLADTTKTHERIHFQQGRIPGAGIYPADVAYTDLPTQLSVGRLDGKLQREIALAIQDYVYVTELQAYAGSFALSADWRTNYRAYAARSISSFMYRAPEPGILEIARQFSRFQTTEHTHFDRQKQALLYPGRLARFAALTGDANLMQKAIHQDPDLFAREIAAQMTTILESPLGSAGWIPDKVNFFTQFQSRVAQSTQAVLNVYERVKS